jgi:tetratricopeptide (TPR) repeat protein
VSGLSRPQPLGLLPLPAGWLVVPARFAREPEVAEAVRALLAGHLPAPWPAALDVLRLAAQDRSDEAAALVDLQAGVEDAYNHFVLTGEAESLRLARSGADGDLAAVVEVAAFALGHADTLPDVAAAPEEDAAAPEENAAAAEDGAATAATRAVAGRLTGEVAAHVLTAHAAARLERGDPQGALDALVAAEGWARTVSPVAAALLLGQQAALLHQVNGPVDDVLAAYQEAVDALRGADAVEPAAGELALGLATAYQERATAAGPAGIAILLQAIQAYHLALRWLRSDAQPQRYAFAHSNLALCYLAMPVATERDRLRRGVAVQSLREALRFYPRDGYPAEWASVTLNLANALQHLPTTHPVENLVEAVGMYEELLEVRTEQADPLGHARVLANQGTALGHLGIHDQAEAKLVAARAIFERHQDPGAVATVDAALTDVSAARAGVPVAAEG